MSQYTNSAFAQIAQKLIPGQPAYLYGAWQRDTSPTKMLVTGVSATTAIATITVLINEGNIPVVGGSISVQGVPNNGGIYNVTATITAVAINALTGTGTVSYAVAGAALAQVATSGYAIAPQMEIGETVQNGFSIACGLPYTADGDAGSQMGAEAIECEVGFPTLPTACVVALQGAMFDSSANYVTIIPNVVTVAGGAATNGTLQVVGKWQFLRYAITGTSGTGTIVAKVAG